MTRRKRRGEKKEGGKKEEERKARLIRAFLNAPKKRL